MASQTIESYLRALRQELRVHRRRKRRILREIRMHLIDASADVGEARAIEALGPPALVAARFAAEEPRDSTRRITGLEFVAGAIVVAAIAAIVVWSSRRGEVTPPPYVHYALQKEQAGDYARARHWISLAVVGDSNNWRLWMIRARIEIEVGDIHAARRSMMHVRRLNPQFATLVTPTPTSRPLRTTPSGGVRVTWSMVKVSSTCSVAVAPSFPVQTPPRLDPGCAKAR